MEQEKETATISIKFQVIFFELVMAYLRDLLYSEINGLDKHKTIN